MREGAGETEERRFRSVAPSPALTNLNIGPQSAHTCSMDAPGPPSEDLAIRTRRLTKTYGDTNVVDGLDLVVPRNSVFGFLGPNGAGKTTTMKMLLGLIRPSSGSGSVYGLDIVDESPAVRRRIGYLPQDPKFYGHMTARETLRFAARFFFIGPQDGIDLRVSEMLELVGLSEKDDRPVRTFSGGEMQRLGIAQAQIHKPDLLILDEPAAALDPLGRRDVLAILDRLREDSTVFYSTHILDDVQRVSDAVCILREGRVAAQGSIAEVLAGNENTTYEVQAHGDLDRAKGLLETEAWVDAVAIEGDHSSGTLRIRVSDNDQAELHLQRRLLADESLVISEFKQLKPNLEDVFVSIVEGATDDERD